MSTVTKSKPVKFLIPARNSRHRIACLALYRALLRLAPQISLPDDLATGWGPGRNPITFHVQRAFRRNVADVSPRIIYPALDAGYRMLSVLLDAATNPTSSHHATITEFLETRLAERQRSLSLRREPAKPAKPRRPPAAPRPGTIPLLVNVTPPPSPADPDPAPVYATPSRPRPQSELGGTGRRKVPRLDMAGDLPFLRLTKPQPPLLSRVLGQKIKRRAERMRDVLAFTDEALPEAQLEDQWDRAMAGLVREEKGAASLSPPRRLWQQNVGPDWQDRHDVGAGSGRDERSHAFALYQHGVVPLFSALSRERTDSVARADAMRRLIHQEKDLAAREKVQRAADKRARWEARMLELHGEGWRDLFPNLKESKERRS